MPHVAASDALHARRLLQAEHELCTCAEYQRLQHAVHDICMCRGLAHAWQQPKHMLRSHYKQQMISTMLVVMVWQLGWQLILTRHSPALLA